MIATDWASTTIAIAAALGVVGAIAAFLVRAFLRWFDVRLKALDRKATPNGGQTLDLGDTVARIEYKQDEQRSLLLYHLAHHPGYPPLPDEIEIHPPPISMVPTRAAVEADNTDNADGQHAYNPVSRTPPQALQ